MSKIEKQIGDEGESVVCDFLKEKGYAIADRNYHMRGGEVDIIATKDNLYVFCEVKTRKSKAYAPSEAVNTAKQKRLVKTAEHYLYTHELWNVDVRFDVAEVLYDKEHHIHYIENAFWKEG